MARIATLLLLPLLSACTTKVMFDSGAIDDSGATVETGQDTASGDTASEDTAPVDTGPTEEELDAIWGDAQLVITSPGSGDFLPLGEPATFTAEVRDADGSLLDFDEIKWASDVDTAWTPVGASFEDTLAVGTHAITASAMLPNGDRLAYTIGGVLVQAEDAGIYAGSVQVDITVEYDGTPYTVSCLGSTTITVDAAGELATGESSCTVALFGYDTEAAQDIELEVADGALSGEVALDLSWFSVDFDASGSVGDGALTASWTDDVYGYATVEGTLEATRISRYLETD